MPKTITIIKENTRGYLPGSTMLATNALANALISEGTAEESIPVTATLMTAEAQPIAPIQVSIQQPTAPKIKKAKTVRKNLINHHKK